MCSVHGLDSQTESILSAEIWTTTGWFVWAAPYKIVESYIWYLPAKIHSSILSLNSKIPAHNHFSLSKMYLTKHCRLFSTKKLWVKFNGNPAIQVPATGINVADVIKEIKKELSPRFDAYPLDEIMVHQSLEEKALRPGLKLSELFKTLKVNTDESPFWSELFNQKLASQERQSTSKILMMNVDLLIPSPQFWLNQTLT